MLSHQVPHTDLVPHTETACSAKSTCGLAWFCVVAVGGGLSHSLSHTHARTLSLSHTHTYQCPTPRRTCAWSTLTPPPMAKTGTSSPRPRTWWERSARASARQRAEPPRAVRRSNSASETRSEFIDNLLVRIHVIIEMTALCHGSLSSLSQLALHLPS